MKIYVKVMIIRGIGFRVFLVINDLITPRVSINSYDSFKKQFFKQHSDEDKQEFLYSRYLVIQAGHTKDLYIGLPRGVSVKVLKKNRKLVVFGKDKNRVNNIARIIYEYRMPSVYTGRGIRRKSIKVRRKAGKKDKQKGRAF